MSLAGTQERLRLPDSLRTQLLDYRARVWTVKIAEAVFAAGFVVGLAYLAVFVLDRVWETPGWVRVALFAAAAVGGAAVPLALYRWVWRNRRLDQLARLLGRTQPHTGDQILGVIELVENELEQSRSRTLCEAAVAQAAEESRGRDFRDAVPNPRHRAWAWAFAGPALAAFALFVAVPSAASNAWARLLAPWSDTPRYTFAAVEPLPARMVVAHGEPFTVAVRLKSGSAWTPERGEARMGEQQPVAALLSKGSYEFVIPAQLDANWLSVRVGDSWHRVRVEPTLRPELTTVFGEVTLPEYLGRMGSQKKDVRGGAVSLVKGSSVRFAATASRPLAEAQVDGLSQTPQGATIVSPLGHVDGVRTVEFRWRDALGLAGKEPFRLTVSALDDEPPSLACENLPRQKVLLDSELLAFKVAARDDFGVKRVGVESRALDEKGIETEVKGERMLAAGGAENDALDVAGTFSAKSLGIEPQPVRVRVFTEDFFPGRPRVYSTPSTFYVLNAEQHAIWVTEQLSKWHRQSLEVRDREMQLYDTNKQLRALTAEELDRPETRRRVENQAAAERANGRRLSGLVVSGEDLVAQAARNPEIGVGHLETWAQMLQVLKDISSNRMPSVADLLKEAAQAPTLASTPTGNRAPAAGLMRSAGAGGPPAEPKKNAIPTRVPTVVDRESSQNSPPTEPSKPSPPGGAEPPRLTLAQTTVTGQAPPGDPPPPSPAAQNLDDAVKKQQDLLAEFDKIADELNRVLANLEGSTLVKRLKAASRLQDKIAGRIVESVGDQFGNSKPWPKGEPPKAIAGLRGLEAKGSQDVSMIMDDLQAYFERRRFVKFKAVLDEMRSLDVIGSLRQLGDDLVKETGVSIAQCEYWSDTLDRWAEDLVDPACNGTCPGSKSKSSLPPSVVLEVLQILEGEVNLREETRVTEQSRPAITAADHARQSDTLADSQNGLKSRVEKVVTRINELPDAATEFAYEINLLGQVKGVMGEAQEILARPETGSPALAAETEAIELLLKSKRINPKAGGGGGSSPGGGGTGTTNDSALALLGKGLNEKEVREDRGVSQATGDAGPSLPEEFRAGLDEYFNRLERGPAGR